MVGHEPAHLVGVVKACPRPGCLSSRVKWCYYNNKKRSQPRYKCLGCNKLFTFGGEIRQSKEEKQAALREKHACDAAAKNKKGPRIKITPAANAVSTNPRALNRLRLSLESRLKRSMISCLNNLSVQPASPISKVKRMRGGRGPSPLSRGSASSIQDSSWDEVYQVDAAAGAGIYSPLLHSNSNAINLPDSPLVENYQIDAGADMNSLLPQTNGNAISVPDISLDEKYQVDAGADTKSRAEFEDLFVGLEDMHGEFMEMFGGSELVALEAKLDEDDVGIGSGAGAPDESQLGTMGDCSPAFSWTSSEHLRGSIVRSVKPPEPVLLDLEEEQLLLVDSGLSSATPWLVVSMDGQEEHSENYMQKPGLVIQVGRQIK